ncbi:lysozyme [Bacteroidia bacterium]|nr:lysozyme [Bacteroidia bacterium]
MKLSDAGKKLIKDFEGLRLKAYQCSAGVWTIGYGHTGAVNEGEEVTQFYADTFFDFDVLRFEDAVNDALMGGQTPPLQQHQFDALVSLAYNIGVAAFKGSTLVKRAKVNPNDPLIGGEFMKWCNANGKYNEGLHKRRAAEAKFYFK